MKKKEQNKKEAGREIKHWKKRIVRKEKMGKKEKTGGKKEYSSKGT